MPNKEDKFLFVLIVVSTIENFKFVMTTNNARKSHHFLFRKTTYKAQFKFKFFEEYLNHKNLFKFNHAKIGSVIRSTHSRLLKLDAPLNNTVDELR